MKKVFLLAAGIVGVMVGTASASTPSGFASTTIALSAEVGNACQEVQHGAFPNPIVINPQAAVDQTFSPTADQQVRCTSGMSFTIKVSSGNGSAVNQTCTSGGISAMALKSARSPADTIPYVFLCAGDTDGLGHFVGAGFNTPRSVGISVKILAVYAQNAVAHPDYSDTVTLTISY